MEIDQSGLEERKRKHVARMRVERIIELIAAALQELEMRAVAPTAEVWAKVDPLKQAIGLCGGESTRPLTTTALLNNSATPS